MCNAGMPGCLLLQLVRVLCDAQPVLPSMQVQLTVVQTTVVLPSKASVTLTCSALPCQPATAQDQAAAPAPAPAALAGASTGPAAAVGRWR